MGKGLKEENEELKQKLKEACEAKEESEDAVVYLLPDHAVARMLNDVFMIDGDGGKEENDSDLYYIFTHETVDIFTHETVEDMRRWRSQALRAGGFAWGFCFVPQGDQRYCEEEGDAQGLGECEEALRLARSLVISQRIQARHKWASPNGTHRARSVRTGVIPQVALPSLCTTGLGDCLLNEMLAVAKIIHLLSPSCCVSLADCRQIEFNHHTSHHSKSCIEHLNKKSTVHEFSIECDVEVGGKSKEKCRDKIH